MAPTTTSQTSKFPTISAFPFRLPALDIDSESLVAGTDLPAPPPSPPPKKSSHPLRSHPTSSHSLSRQFTESSPDSPARPKADSNASNHEPMTPMTPTTPMTTNTARESIATRPSMSTPSQKRPHSVRKLLSLRSLNSFSGNHGHKNSDSWSTRPETPSADSVVSGQPSLKKRRSSAFWGRKGSTLGQVGEDTKENNRDEKRARKGTPPPTLPGLGLDTGVKEKDGGFLGGISLFSNIK